MEMNINDASAAEFPESPQRPEMLKVLCILSFIMCGLLLIAYSIGSMFISLKAETIAEVWEKVIESNPQFADRDPVEFFHEFGTVCLYGLIATVFSLVGVLMMWRLDRIGFFIYSVAELSTNLFSMSGEAETRSYGGTIFMVLLDLVFIALYFTQLKYMTRRR
jgi:hypothetical protein